jgi:hypothetical protein
MVKKKYFEGALTRFFSWPKTKLVGNRFHFVDKDDSRSGYYQEKLPRSNRVSVKIIAGILYPLFNPIAFVFRKLGMLFADYQEVQKSVARHDAKLTNAKNTIKQTADKLAANAQTSTAIIKLFKQPEEDITAEWNKLRVKVVAADGFICSNPENKAKFTELFSTSCTNFLLVVKAFEQIVAEENIASPEAFAFRLIDQNSKDEISFAFNHAVLRTFYSLIRANNNKLEHSSDYKDADENEDEDNTPKFWFTPVSQGGIDTKSHQNAENFYIKGREEYTWRKMYNFCIKALCSHSLYSAKAVNKADARGELSRAIDKSKKENYIPTTYSY